MDGNCIYKDWKTKLLDLFCIVVLNMTFLWKFQDEVQIPGFMNIEHRQWVRAVRRARRSHFSYMWGDTPESRQVEDIFDLRRLFGEEPYDAIEEEQWVQEDVVIAEEQEDEEQENEELIDRCVFFVINKLL
ncbi:hypothetical protein CAJAP_08793 [Camponotus japonicus]